MRITIATPLYPPDIGGGAVYVKELARRLAQQHDITVVAYSHLPEHVPGVHIIPIDKRVPLPLRVVRFTWALIGALRNTDILIAENGPSVELPAALASLTRGVPLIVHVGDVAAWEYAHSHLRAALTKKIAQWRACRIITHQPLARPEILPFTSQHSRERTTYERSWNEHLEKIASALEYA